MNATPAHTNGLNIYLTFLPNQIGTPMMIAGAATAAISPMPTGAPASIPSCHRIFFFLLQGFLPQNVQPDGLETNMDIVRNLIELHRLSLILIYLINLCNG